MTDASEEASTEVRLIEVNATIQSTDKGVLVVLKSPDDRVVCTYEFDIDVEMKVLMDMIKMSPQAIIDLLEKVSERVLGHRAEGTASSGVPAGSEDGPMDEAAERRDHQGHREGTS